MLIMAFFLSREHNIGAKQLSEYYHTRVKKERLERVGIIGTWEALSTSKDVLYEIHVTRRTDFRQEKKCLGTERIRLTSERAAAILLGTYPVAARPGTG
jgi:hypothetical protein